MTADETETGMVTICPECSSDFEIPSASATSRPDKILVTSGDLKLPYEIRNVVFFSLGTRGGMADEFKRLKEVNLHRLATIKQRGQISSTDKGVGQIIGGIGLNAEGDIGLAAQFSGASFNSKDIELAFHIAVGELQLRASYLGANAIIGFRYDVDFDSNANVINFFVSAYGTAVKITAAE